MGGFCYVVGWWEHNIHKRTKKITRIVKVKHEHDMRIRFFFFYYYFSCLYRTSVVWWGVGWCVLWVECELCFFLFFEYGLVVGKYIYLSLYIYFVWNELNIYHQSCIYWVLCTHHVSGLLVGVCVFLFWVKFLLSKGWVGFYWFFMCAYFIIFIAVLSPIRRCCCLWNVLLFLYYYYGGFYIFFRKVWNDCHTEIKEGWRSWRGDVVWVLRKNEFHVVSFKD